MLSLKRPALLALWAAGIAIAQPALTTIQDTLYRADGTRFTGTVYITWTSFQAGDQSNIATANLTVPIVNGALRVRLVPTTTATAGAHYDVRYNSQGINDFVETWAVPPSNVTLRIRDVRISAGTIVGPPPVTTPVQIPDVVGLDNELAIRPQKGVGFGVGRVAVINQAGQLDAASGNLSDCVRVDGTAGTCGGGGGAGGTGGVLPGFSDAEVPAGIIDGSNALFTITYPPSPIGSLNVFRNGILLRAGAEYSLGGNSITFMVGFIPKPGDLLQAYYRYGDPSNPLSSFTAAQVVCSGAGAGATVSATTSTRLATCTIPAGLMQAGDRLFVEFHFGHTGTSVGFTGEVRIGSALALLRSVPSTETILTGKAALGTFSTGQVWDVQSWGTTAAFAVSAGTSAQDLTQALQFDLRGQLAAAGTDTVTLRNFTVLRYPAQSNP